jgi:hypothetical protein
MNEPPNAGLPRRIDQDLRISNRADKGRRPMMRADPVGVVKRVGAAQRIDERVRPVEIERPSLDATEERARWIRMVGQRAQPAPAFEQSGRDEPAGVAEGSGYDVEQPVAPMATRSPTPAGQ